MVYVGWGCITKDEHTKNPLSQKKAKNRTSCTKKTN